MSSLAAASVEPTAAEEKKPLKPCCACPETKKARDACDWQQMEYEKVIIVYMEDEFKRDGNIIEKGEESCTHLIEAHKDCMRALGFKI